MTIQFEGINIAYHITGSGKPVVLLHGYLETSEVWKPLTEKISGELRVIAIDLPGHGDSGVKGDTHSM